MDTIVTEAPEIMADLQKYFKKNSLFLKEIFNLLKLNIEYSFNFVEVIEEECSLKFYEEVEYPHKNFDFFDFTRRYQLVNNITSTLEGYMFSLKKIFSQSKNKVFIFKVDERKGAATTFFILQVDLETYKRHVNHDFNCNFLDFLFDQIFYKISHDFITRKSGVMISTLGAREVISLATKNFIDSLEMKGDRQGIDIFETINTISRMKYENNEAIGEIVISRLNSLIINNILRVEEEISIREIRKVRKLLEGTKGNFSLVTDLENIYGFGSKGFLKTLKGTFRVKILSSEHWELFYGEKKLLKIVDGIPIFDKILLEKQDFIGRVGTVFGTLLTWEKERLWNLVEEIIESDQGALLVITEGYLEEAKRLAIHSTVFKPFEMKNNLMLDFFKIDGAILMSPRRMCSAIGVILDGVLSENGDSSRGARFNSALKYYDTQKEQYKMIIVVASEDGAVDILG